MHRVAHFLATLLWWSVNVTILELASRFWEVLVAAPMILCVLAIKWAPKGHDASGELP
jgi:hypothetical protein